MMSPSSLAVRALKFLQKSMMFTPAWPRAGPTGGAGVALPAGICSLIDPVTFFIVPSRPRLELLDLQEVQLDGRGPPEDGHHDLQRVPIQVDLLDHALEVREGAVDDADAIAALEGVLRLRLLDRFLDLDEDLVRLFLAERHRPVARAHEPRHLRRVLHEVPGGVGDLLLAPARAFLGLDLDQAVAR